VGREGFFTRRRADEGRSRHGNELLKFSAAENLNDCPPRRNKRRYSMKKKYLEDYLVILFYSLPFKKSFTRKIHSGQGGPGNRRLIRGGHPGKYCAGGKPTIGEEEEEKGATRLSVKTPDKPPQQQKED